MDVKEIFKRIKAAFDMPIPPAPAPAPPAAPTGMTSCSYLIDGGGPIHVDISDDGIPDIDANDKVYSDSAMTIPYPDGTYNVTGTTFGFTVAGGIVTVVNDTAGTGPGAPVDDAAMAKPPAAAPALPPAVPPAQPVTLSAEQFAAMVAKFATGTPEERIANLEIMTKALMECNFGYDIRKGQEQTAIQAYKDTLANTQAQVATAVTQMESAFAKVEDQNKIIAKHEETIKGLFELCEKLCELPTADPATLNGGKKEKFARTNDKEARIQKMADAVKSMKEEAKK